MRVNMSHVKAIVFLLCFVLGLEIFLCNYRFWISHILPGYSSRKVDHIVCSDDLFNAGNEYQSIEGADAYIDILDVDEIVHSLYLDMSYISVDEKNKSDVVKICLQLNDEGFSQNYEVPNKGDPVLRVIPSIPQSKWIRLHPYGKVNGIRITFNGINVGDTVIINNIELNKPCPFYFSFVRIFLVFVFLLVVKCIMPGSNLYNIRFHANSKKQIFVSAVAIAIIISFMGQLREIAYSRLDKSPGVAGYQQLAEALSEGHVYLNKTPPEYLSNLDNPYDVTARVRAADEAGESYLWDTAFYNGKYYVYFGIIPVLLYHLPYYLVTGEVLPNNSLPAFYSDILTIVGLAFLLRALIRKWFKNTPFLVYLIFVFGFGISFGGITIISNAQIYETAIITGVMFAVWGLYFWVSSTIKEKMSYGRVALGSLCMALVIECRPPVFLVFVLAIILFKPLHLVFGNNKNKEKIKFISSFCIPFLVVAVFAMWYNYIRFGNPFDFGANYNLTIYDMSKRDFNIDITSISLFEYFLQPIHLKLEFPYVQLADINIQYNGWIFLESIIGGIFAICPFAVLGLGFLLKRYAKTSTSDVVYFARCAMLIGVIIAVVEGNVSGMTDRYQVDFLYLFYMCSVLFVMQREHSATERTDICIHSFRKIWILLVFISIIVAYLGFWVAFRFDPKDDMTLDFYRVYHMIEFWH